MVAKCQITSVTLSTSFVSELKEMKTDYTPIKIC